MPLYDFLRVTRDGPVERVTLNRPEVRNAFNARLVAELTAWATSVATDPEVRVAVLAGAGAVFCAGGDLAWMSQMVQYSEEENLRDARELAALFAALDTLPVPLIGRVHGAALGGGAGLCSVCDIVAAEDAAVFGFTEVKLGLVPSVISPYTVAKIGRSAARELFLTGARFSAARAREIGLVHAVVRADRLDEAIAGYVAEALTGGREAIAGAKALITEVWHRQPTEAVEMTAAAIAARRVSAEGQEGMRAFLEKRRPSWSRSQN
jgi:methylglutaconyl-CoA hydratase